MAHRIDSLDNIQVKRWSNNKIFDIDREQNEVVVWTSDSAQGDLESPIFPKICTTTDCRLVKRHPLESIHGSCKDYVQKQLPSDELHPI
jgi:hypothetical protein